MKKLELAELKYYGANENALAIYSANDYKYYLDNNDNVIQKLDNTIVYEWNSVSTFINDINEEANYIIMEIIMEEN